MSNIVIVTRHTGMVEWLKNNNVVGEVITHATPDNVRGKIVVGVLPMNLASLTDAMVTVDMPGLPAEMRGKDLTPEQMDEYGAVMSCYRVSLCYKVVPESDHPKTG